MHIEIDISRHHYNDNLVDVVFYRHYTLNKNDYVVGLASLSGIPKYQALAMQNALKAADPQDYPKCTLTVLSGGLTDDNRATAD